jgi:hypothetical protein
MARKLSVYARIKIFEKANNRCELCGWDTYPQVLEVHHKDRNHKNNDANNLIALCPICHRLEHYKSSKWHSRDFAQQYTRDFHRRRYEGIRAAKREEYLQHKEGYLRRAAKGHEKRKMARETT